MNRLVYRGLLSVSLTFFWEEKHAPLILHLFLTVVESTPGWVCLDSLVINQWDFSYFSRYSKMQLTGWNIERENDIIRLKKTPKRKTGKNMTVRHTFPDWTDMLVFRAICQNSDRTGVEVQNESIRGSDRAPLTKQLAILFVYIKIVSSTRFLAKNLVICNS